MSLIREFFSKPTFSVQPIGADRAEECERLHAASFAFPWSSSDFESYLTDHSIISDGAVNDITSKGPLGGFIMSRLAPPDAELLTFAVDPARRGTGLGRALLSRHLLNLE
ncbi:MAG: GNAT family N-acetyltransferase, partial [Methylocystis sp.]